MSITAALAAASSVDPLLACPCFDGDGYAISRPANWRQRNFPRQMVSGGPSQRILGDADKLWLAKTPLLLEPGIFYVDPHTVLPVRLNFSPMQMALLHFRLAGSLPGKISRVADLGYSCGSIDTYQALGQKLRENAEFTFWYPGSTNCESPRQFIDRSMIAATGIES